MSKKVLIVDDKESIAQIVSMYLKDEFEVLWLDSPVKAIAWLQQRNTPDLIISDIKMPDMRGDEFIKYLKSHELYRHIPIVVLSSEDSTSERIRLLEMGAEDYIVKPFSPIELNVRIKKLLL